MSDCAVCGESSVIIANSGLGAFSLAYCQRCYDPEEEETE